MRHFVTCSVLSAALLLSSCSMQKFLAWENPQSPPPYKKAHSVCVKCHTTGKPKPGGALFAAGADPSTACLDCHDYKENHHPVDYVPPDPSNSSFPLFEEKVTCLTCHEIHGGPDKEGTHNLLRGGPYQDRREICFRCHSGEKYAAINPHAMLDDSNNVREVNGKPICLLCHMKMPDTAEDSTDDVRFRADIGFLCWRCHPPMPDPFFATHFLVKPSAKTLDQMHQSEERLLVVLPIVPRGRITCSTCHNPHQKGVVQRESAAKGADTKGRLRLSSICFACHSI